MENKTHAKMFKAGKNWAVALMTIATLGSAGVAGVAGAAGVDTNNVNASSTHYPENGKKMHKVTVEFWVPDAKGNPGKKVGAKTYRLADFDFIAPANDVPAGYTTANNPNGLLDIEVSPEDHYRYVDEVVPLKKKTTTKATTAKAKNYLGTVHVNYNKHYGIQIWTKEGKAVLYNAADAKAAGKKVGSAKKLPGQSSWKVYSKYTKNGKTYYGLGGDQYIEASYVTFKAAK